MVAAFVERVEFHARSLDLLRAARALENARRPRDDAIFLEAVE